MAFQTMFGTASGYVVRCDPSGVQSGTVAGTAIASSILGGPLTNTHVVNSPCSTVVMGNTNIINAAGIGADGYNSIINGFTNTLSGYHNSILGGSNNQIDVRGCYNTIGNGDLFPPICLN